MTTIAEYYKYKKLYNNSTAIMFKERQQAINTALSKLGNNRKDYIESLERELTAMFQPDSVVEVNGQMVRFYDQINKEYEKILGKKFNGFINKDSYFNEELDKDVADLLHQASSRYKSSNRQNLTIGVLKRDIQFCKDLLNKIGEVGYNFNPNLINELNKETIKIMGDLQTLVEDLGLEQALENVEKSVSPNKRISSFGKKLDTANIDILKRVDAYFNTLRAAYSVKEIGDWGEVGLSLFGALMNQAQGMVINDLTEEVKKNIKGAKYVSGDNLLSIEKVVMGNQNFNKFLKNTTDLGTQTYKFEDGSKTVTFTSRIGAKRQGKVDVTFEYGENHTPFRVSMKNWKNLEDKNFGHTSLLNAMGRSVTDSKVMEHFLYSTAAVKASSPQLNSAQKLARTSILLDILMGYSQKNNYADTLIILDRSQHRVLVYDLYDVIMKATSSGMAMQEIIELDYNKVREDFIDAYGQAYIRYITQSKDQTQSFKLSLLKIMQSVRVKALYNPQSKAFKK